MHRHRHKWDHTNRNQSLFPEQCSVRLWLTQNITFRVFSGSGLQIKLIDRARAGSGFNTLGPGSGRAGFFRPDLTSNVNTSIKLQLHHNRWVVVAVAVCQRSSSGCKKHRLHVSFDRRRFHTTWYRFITLKGIEYRFPTLHLWLQFKAES